MTRHALASPGLDDRVGVSTDTFGERPRSMPGGRDWPSRSRAGPRSQANRSRGACMSCSPRTVADRAAAGPNWFRPQPFFAIDVENWKPGEPLRIDSRAVGFPGPLNEARAGPISHPGRDPAQPRHAPDRRRRRKRLWSGRPRQARSEGGRHDRVEGRHDRAPRPFPTTDRIKLVELPEPEALGVSSPADQAPRGGDPARRRWPRRSVRAKRPTLYIIPGFGGDHFMALGSRTIREWPFGKDFIRVMLDPDCGTGHHVFADSATNGPRGAAPGRGVHPATSSRTFPAIARPACPAAQRPFVRRLEQPLAPGDLSRRFRRHLVDQPGPGRFSRLSADQPLRRRARTCSETARESAGRSRGWARHPCSFTTGSRGWTT